MTKAEQLDQWYVERINRTLEADALADEAKDYIIKIITRWRKKHDPNNPYDFDSSNLNMSLCPPNAQSKTRQKFQDAITTIQGVLAYQAKYLNNPRIDPWIRGSTDRWSCAWLGSRRYDYHQYVKDAHDLEQDCLAELKELDRMKRQHFYITLT